MEEAITAAAPDTASPEEIRAMVEAAVQGATASQVTGEDIQGLVSRAVEGAISSAVAGQTEPLSAAEVAKIVDAAVMAIPTAAPIEIVRTVVVTEFVTETVAAPEAVPDYWNPPTAVYGEPIYGGHLRINFEDPMEHANTWGAYTAAVTRFRTPVHNSLVGEDPYVPAQIIPDLAANWSNDFDGQGITFNFVSGVKWHNGTSFTCEDARFSIETMATGDGLTASEMAGKLSFIDLDNTTCQNDQTLNVRFNGPSSTALFAFIDRGFLLFSKDWFLEGGENAMFNDVSVGTGPFIWDASHPVGDDEQVFDRNPDYFKPGLPYVDKVTVFGILDEATQQAVMLARQTDWHWVRNFGQYDAYVAHDQIQTVIRATRGHHSITLNPANPPFDNVKVRQAIMMGVDRGAAIKVLLSDHGSTGFIMPPGGQWDLTEAQGCAVEGWCAPAGGYDAQRAEAKATLEAEGFDFDKTYVMTVEGDEQVSARATFLQEQLRLLGIKTDFDLVESVAWRQQVTTGTWGDILPSNTTMPADDPFLGMAFYHSCKSATNYLTPQTDCDPESERLLENVATAVSFADQKAASDELQLYLMGTYTRFPLYWEQEAVAFWPEVRGYVHQPQPSGPFLRWEQIWLDPSLSDQGGFSGQISGLPGGL